MDRAERQSQRKRGLVLATAGLLLALAVGLSLQLLGLTHFSYRLWARAVALTVLVQGALWLVVHRGWNRRLSWDPHFVLIPTLAAAFLLNVYVYVSPDSRFRVLMVWFVALLFLAGLAGFRETVLLSAAMTIGYVGVIRILIGRGEPLSMAYELSVAGVFWVITLYAGFVFERLRRERTEMKELRRRLAELALTDPLTGLPNRRQFEQTLRTELARLQRHGGSCTLAMIDVDNFKQYNDALGHVAGDRALAQIGALIRTHLRAGDVGSRYGGDEFAAIIHGTRDSEAVGTLERLRAILESHRFAGAESLPGGRLTISVGLASAPRDAGEYEELVRQADAALYRAKSGGRNRVCVPGGGVGRPSS